MSGDTVIVTQGFGAHTMWKAAALIVIILSALTSAAGFLLLAGKITAGERQIADGRELLKEGYVTLREGKSKLEAGRRELSAGKERYARTEDNLFLVLADRLLAGRLYSRYAQKRIAAGDKRVAEGEGKTEVGKGFLDAGTLGLSRGRYQIRRAKYALVVCAFGALCFASLAILLGFRWWRSLALVPLHAGGFLGWRGMRGH